MTHLVDASPDDERIKVAQRIMAVIKASGLSLSDSLVALGLASRVVGETHATEDLGLDLPVKDLLPQGVDIDISISKNEGDHYIYWALSTN